MCWYTRTLSLEVPSAGTRLCPKNSGQRAEQKDPTSTEETPETPRRAQQLTCRKVRAPCSGQGEEETATAAELRPSFVQTAFSRR